MRWIVRNVIWVTIILGVSAFIVLMGSLIFPGAMNWTGSFVCPDDQTTTIVVRDTYQTEPGETSTNFTLYCVGERGQFTDAGFFQPLLWLWIFFAGAMVALITILRIWSRLRGGRDSPPTVDLSGRPAAEPDGMDIIT